MSQATMQWYRLRWPRDVEEARLRILSRLLASSGGSPVALEAVGSGGSVEHRLGLPTSHGPAVTEHLRAALPGLSPTQVGDDGPFAAGRVLELRLTTPLRPLWVEQPETVARAIVTALALARKGERVLLQWQLLTALPARPVRSAAEQAEALPMSVGDVLLGRRGRLDGEGLRALRAKRELPVWRAVGLLAVRAGSEAREQQLLRELMNALRLAESPGVRLLVRRRATGRVDRIARSWFAPLRINTAELVALSGWPVGALQGWPVEHGGPRPLPASKVIPSRGRIVGRSTFPGRERLVALAPADGLRHLHVLGPTGVGKSTLLLNLIASDIAAGRGVVVVEPKGDLIRDVLRRIPPGRLDDVVLLDPSDEQRPVGLNPLADRSRAPELVADQLLIMFRRLYESSWGPRTNDILGASLLTLARTPGMTICALPALLSDAGFRQRLVGELDDPIGLEPFWLAYEAWSDAERLTAIAPTMNRIRPFLLRPQLRSVLGQGTPRFDLAQIFSRRKILLVNLAKGEIGAEAAALLGSLLLTELWGVAQRRTTIPAERRHPVFVYIDEFQDYLNLPADLGEALAQARSLDIGFVLAHQHLTQLDPAIRSAVLNNARSRICFELAADDARAIANGPLAAEDLRSLGAFETYMQLVAGGAVQPWCSAASLPPPTEISDPDEVRRRSRERYGRDRAEVDAELAQLLGGLASGADDLAPRVRTKGAKR